MRVAFRSDRENDHDDEDPERFLMVEDVDLYPNEHPESACTDEAQHRVYTEHGIPVVDDDAGFTLGSAAQTKVRIRFAPVRRSDSYGPMSMASTGGTWLWSGHEAINTSQCRTAVDCDRSKKGENNAEQYTSADSLFHEWIFLFGRIEFAEICLLSLGAGASCL